MELLEIIRYIGSPCLDIPRFCTEVNDACKVFQVSLDELQKESNVRVVLKKKIQ